MPRNSSFNTTLKAGDYFMKQAGTDISAHYVVLDVRPRCVIMIQLLPIGEFERFSVEAASSWRLRSYWKKMRYVRL